MEKNVCTMELTQEENQLTYGGYHTPPKESSDKETRNIIRVPIDIVCW